MKCRWGQQGVSVCEGHGAILLGVVMTVGFTTSEVHLGCVVRVASASLFQLHLRVQLLLILLHDVRQVRATAAFAVILFIVTIVRL